MGYVGPRGIPLEEFLRWPQAAQDAALAWQAHEAARCAGCGRHPDDAPRHPHVEVCPDCRALAAVQREVKRDEGEHVAWVHGSAADCPTCNPNAKPGR